MVNVALHVAVQEPGDTDEVAPVGSPEIEYVTGCADPDVNVAVTVLATADPRATLLAPPVATVKSNAAAFETVTETVGEVVVLFDVSRATAVRLCDPFDAVVVFQEIE
jgi:hypothetical protein